MNKKIAIIGAGSWGTTLAVIFSRKGLDVELHSVFSDHNASMQKERENSLFLKGSAFPDNLVINPGLKEVLCRKVIVIAVPVQFMRPVLKRFRKETASSFRDTVFVSVSKGIEISTFKMPSQLIAEETGARRIAVLSGPTIAGEVLAGVPTACVVASRSRETAAELQTLFSTERFRVYSHGDVRGVEMGGALKNIVAIACGISDGLGFGTNTKAALVTRGIVEISRLGRALGARAATFSGISGLGDLATTCFSPYSRNRTVGEQIGRGKRVRDVLGSMKMVAEGVATARAAFMLSKKLGVEMPITREVYHVLFKNKRPEKAVRALMTRPLRSEGIV